MKFFGSDQRIYIKCSGNIFVGFIKIGRKKLFIYTKEGNMKEIFPLCVLDFYTYEGCQRRGYGWELFTTMLQFEGMSPAELGYDRPSYKFLNFLKKYFGLVDYMAQNNNFVVFDEYFKVIEHKQKEEEEMKKKEMANNQIKPNVQGTQQISKEQPYIGNQCRRNENVNQEYGNMYQYKNQQIQNNEIIKNVSSNENMQGVLDSFAMPKRNYHYSTTSSAYGEFNKNY